MNQSVDIQGRNGMNGLNQGSKSSNNLILSSRRHRPNAKSLSINYNKPQSATSIKSIDNNNICAEVSPRRLMYMNNGAQQQPAFPCQGDIFMLQQDDSTASSEMSIPDQRRTRAQKIPKSHEFNTVIANKRLSIVDLESLSGSDSKQTTKQTLFSVKNIDQLKLFDVFNNTDDIDDSPTSQQESKCSGIKQINDTQVPKSSQKQQNIEVYQVGNQDLNTLIQERIAAARNNERQIKYLGLIIEKDEEQLIDPQDTENFTQTQRKKLVKLLEQPNDNVKRQYHPIREKYIKIVKGSRKLCIDCFEKRGRKDFKRTKSSLKKVRDQIEKDNFENRLNAVKF